jgi:hypothetical protein
MEQSIGVESYLDCLYLLRYNLLLLNAVLDPALDGHQKGLQHEDQSGLVGDRRARAVSAKSPQRRDILYVCQDVAIYFSAKLKVFVCAVL